MYRLFGDFAKIVGSLCCKQNLLDESHVLKQIEDISCWHSHSCRDPFLRLPRPKHNSFEAVCVQKVFKFEIQVAIFGSMFLILETATADLF